MLTLFGACPFLLSAQNIDIQSDDDKPLEEKLVYNHQNSFHVAMHTRGLGAGFKIGRIKSIHVTRNWEAQVVSLRSLKELKTLNMSSFNMRPFVYGKLNYAYVARFGYGEERRIFGKPYYYYVVTYIPNGSGGYVESVQEQTFEQGIDILGRSAFTKGLGESKLSPGAHASLGLSFDIAKSRTSVQAINVDVKVECFPMGVSIIDSERDRWLFVTFMLSYNWGSRFNNY